MAGGDSNMASPGRLFQVEPIGKRVSFLREELQPFEFNFLTDRTNTHF